MNKSTVWKSDNLLKEPSNSISLDSSDVIIYANVGAFLEFDAAELDCIGLFSPMSAIEKRHANRPYIDSEFRDNDMYEFDDFSSILRFMRDAYGLNSTIKDWSVNTKNEICFDNLCTASFDNSGYPIYTPVKPKTQEQVNKLLSTKNSDFLGLMKIYCTLQIDIQGTLSSKDTLKLL